MLQAIKLIWAILSLFGFIYSVSILRNAINDLADVIATENISAAVVFQAKLNRRFALYLTCSFITSMTVGIISFFNEGNVLLGTIVVFGLILGLGLNTLIAYTVDTGRTKLRSLVGGRRKTDRMYSGGNEDCQGMGK